MSNEGPKQIVLDLNTITTQRSGLRKTPATPTSTKKPVQATVSFKQAEEVIVTIKTKEPAKLVPMKAVVRQAPNAPALPARKESLVKNPNVGRVLPKAPVKKVEVAKEQTPPPVPPRDDVVEAPAKVVVAPLPPAAPAMSVAPITPVTKGNAALLGQIQAGMTLKKTVTVDKSALVVPNQVNTTEAAPAELRRRIAESTLRRSGKPAVATSAPATISAPIEIKSAVTSTPVEVAPAVISVPVPPAPPAPPQMPALSTKENGARPALLFSASDLAGKKLKKTEVNDKSAPVIAKQENRDKVPAAAVVNNGAVAPLMTIKPLNKAQGVDAGEELRKRIAESAARRSIKF